MIKFIVYLPIIAALLVGTKVQADTAKGSTKTQDQGEFTFGVGIATVIGAPEYIGSDQSKNYLLPVPYISYKGPRLKVNRSGITGKLFNSDKWFLSLSLSGAIAVDSKDNEARAGMEDLEAVIEFGPSLKYFFHGQDDTDDALYFDANIRHARTLSLDSLSYTASPAVVWRHKLPYSLFSGEVKLTSQLRWEFVSDDYANYFYGVEASDVTSTRAEFDASGGYAGYRFNNSLRWQRGQYVVSLFVGYANLAGAHFVASPLVKRQQHLFAGGAVFWLFDW